MLVLCDCSCVKLLVVLEPFFVSFWKKITISKNVLLFVFKCLKFNCFMLQNQKMKCLVLLRNPHFRPSFKPLQRSSIYKSIDNFGSEGLGERNVQTEKLTF